jgi:hypothetical protein
MAVTILSQGAVSDGYDVRVTLESGDTSTFHFLSRPADVQADVEALAASWEARVIVYDITGEG